MPDDPPSSSEGQLIESSEEYQLRMHEIEASIRNLILDNDRDFRKTVIHLSVLKISRTHYLNSRRTDSPLRDSSPQSEVDGLASCLALIVSLVAKPKDGEAFLADMDELRGSWVERHGTRRAKQIYRWQLFRAIFSFALAPLKRLAGAVLGQPTSGG